MKTICVIGLGYVGLPLAVSFAEAFKVIGFDINERRINELNSSFDNTYEVSKQEITNSQIIFTNSEEDLKNIDIFIVTVPTPVTTDKKPDLSMLTSASELVGKKLSQDNIIVFESTVFPGCTEEICIPILEKESGLLLNKNFGVGYSPERINPGDAAHSFKTISKVISASNNRFLDKIEEIYSKVINAEIFRAKSIKVAEASKIIENTQRDINIALMNEFSTILSKMNIRSKDVLDAASTKWNFINFEPGLVGGHCIGVDPYYLAFKADELGITPKVILAGRETNNMMPNFIIEKVLSEKNLSNPEVLILGLTFKENCPDIRNSKSFDLIRGLNLKGIKPYISDIYVNSTDITNKRIEANFIDNIEEKHVGAFDIIFFLVPHDEYIEKGYSFIKKLLKQDGYFFDLKSKFESQFTNGSL